MSNVFQRDKIPFRMLGKEYRYEFIPSIHFQEVLTGVGNLLMTLTFDDGEVTGVNDAALLPQVLHVTRNILNDRLYQIIADVLENQNGERVNTADLKLKTRPLEITEFLKLLIDDPELEEAITTLGKSLAGLMTRLQAAPSGTLNSTPSSPTPSDSTGITSTDA